MSSQTSGSEPATSSAFDLLHPSLQRWVYDEGWMALREVQEQAVPLLLGSDRDVILAATTASGKTEAAFLPMLSNLAFAPSTPGEGAEVLCISPLKALINDQFARLEEMCERAQVPVHRWHGDVSASAKATFTKKPSGVLVITPESLEAMFVLRGDSLAKLFAPLRYMVIDELHAFIGTQRGAQVQSLLHRLDLILRREPPRVGLSATIGNIDMAKSFLRPTAPGVVSVVDCSGEGFDLQLQLRGYVDRAATPAGDGGGALFAIADHLFKTLRGSNNLVFANARGRVETLSDMLTQWCEQEHFPNEFWPHHGNLSKEVREDVEARLKDHNVPATVICTSTLELGIDVGAVSSVAQVGPPPSVAVLRQRVGRSGRRGEPAVLRLYSSVPELVPKSDLIDELRCPLVQSISMVNLLLRRWMDSPTSSDLNLSTLIQQSLSMISQHGGAKAAQLYRVLCGPGPFAAVDAATFAQILRSMARSELITQDPSDILLLGRVGEKIVSHFTFYAVFETPTEWRVTTGGRPLGTLSPQLPPTVGDFLIFAGRRWEIAVVDAEAELIDVTPSPAGKVPHFDSELPPLSNAARDEMVAVYEGTDVANWLAADAAEILAEARAAWRRADLSQHTVFEAGHESLVFPWVGDLALATATRMLRGRGVAAEIAGPAIRVPSTSAGELESIALAVVSTCSPDPLKLAEELGPFRVDKWDWVLDEDLLARANADRCIDVEGAMVVFGKIVADGRS